MRVLVCGGRSYANRRQLFESLDFVRSWFGDFTLVHGGASGADTLASEWAKSVGLPIDPHPVTKEEWNKLGKIAGPIRNQKMLDSGIDLVVAFPGGKGTADMVTRTRKAKINLMVIRDEQETK